MKVFETGGGPGIWIVKRKVDEIAQMPMTLTNASFRNDTFTWMWPVLLTAFP